MLILIKKEEKMDEQKEFKRIPQMYKYTNIKYDIKSIYKIQKI